MNKRRLARGAGALVGVSLLLFLAFCQWSSSWLEMAKPALVQQLSTAAGGELSIGALELEQPLTVVLRDVVLRNDRQSQVPLLRAERLAVHLNPWRALWAGESLKAVDKVEISRPVVLVRQDERGQWEWEDFLRRRPEQPSKLEADLVLRGGEVQLDVPQGSWKLEQLDGTVTVGAASKTAVELEARLDGETVRAEGVWNDGGQGRIGVQVPRLSLAFLAPLLPAEAPVRSLTGALTEVAVSLRQQGTGRPAVSVDAQLEEVSADVAGVPLRQVRGMVAVAPLRTASGSEAYLALRGQAASQPFSLRGQLTLPQGADGSWLDEEQLTFALDLASERVNLEQVSSYLPAQLALPVRGQASFTLRLEGTLAEPQLTGKVSLETGTVQGVEVRNAEGWVQADRRQLTVASFKGEVAGGLAEGSGWAAWESRQYRVAAKIRNLSVDQLAPWVPAVAESGAAGVLDADGYAAGQGWEQPPARLEGLLAWRQGRVRGVVFEEARLALQQDGGGQQLQGQLACGAGSADLTGRLEGKQLALQLYGTQLPLARLQPLLPAQTLDGSADVALRLDGAWPELQGLLDLKAVQGQLGGLPYDAVVVRAAVAGDRVTLEQGELRRGEAVHQLAGWLEWRGAQRLALEATSRQARLEELLRLVPGSVPVPVTGSLENTVAISGTWQQPALKGRFVLRDGSIGRGEEGAAYFFSRLRGSYVLHEDGSLALDDVLLNLLRARISAAGTIDAQGRLALRLEASDVDLARLQVHYPYPVEGLVSFTGTVGGSLAQPEFRGDVAVPLLVLNGQKVQQVQGRLESVGYRVTVPSFSAQLGQGRFSFQGEADLATGAVDGLMQVNNARIAALLPMLSIRDANVDGRLDGTVRLGGKVGSPTLDLQGQLRDGLLRGYPLEQADVHLGLEGQVFTVHRFEARQGQAGLLAARGTVDLQGECQLEVGGSSLDAGLLTTWFLPKLTAQGSLEFVAQLSGPASNPFVNLSVGIAKGMLGGVYFDAATALLLIDQQKIEVEQAVLITGPYRARVKGRLPLAALRGNGGQNEPLDLRLGLDEANLGMLPIMLPQIAWAEGPVQGEIRLGGTWAQPLLYGQVEVPKGSLKLKALKDPLQEVHFKLDLDGTRLSLQDLSGTMGGGSVSLSGAALLQGRTLQDYQGLLRLAEPRLDSTYFKGPVQGELRLSQAGELPLVSGRLAVGKGNVLNIPLALAAGALEADAAMDVDLVAERGTRLYNPLLYDMEIEGAVHAGGTLQQPHLSGDMHTYQGTVKYLRTPFKVQVARAEFGRGGTFLPTVQLRASTRLQQNQIQLAVTGPVENMELQLTSEPARSQAELIKLLTLRGRTFSGTGTEGQDTSLGSADVYDLLSTGLEMRLVSDVEDSLRDMLGMDEFRLVRGYALSEMWLRRKETLPADTEEQYNLRLGKYLGPKFFFAYTSSFDRNLYTLEAKYEFNRRFGVFAATNEEGRNIIGLETRIRF